MVFGVLVGVVCGCCFVGWGVGVWVEDFVGVDFGFVVFFWYGVGVVFCGRGFGVGICGALLLCCGRVL